MDELQSVFEADIDPGEAAEPTPPLMCRQCFSAVTSADEALAVSGAHAHRCINPAGQLFDIRCFREAWGVLATSKRETWFSWFHGHSWQAVACSQCKLHLGWRFDGPSTFYGLIASALSSQRSRA